MRYRRVLLKLSGESLGGPEGHGISAVSLRARAEDLVEAHRMGVHVAVVPGGGNIVRGGRSAFVSDRVAGDSMGMLATVINALALADCIRGLGVPVFVRASFAVGTMVPEFDTEEARRLVGEGHIGIFAGGTGNPFFTTDTAAVLRALQIQADALLKGTRVDGVYSGDPEQRDDVTRYSRVSYDTVLTKGLAFMDLAATALCQDNGLPVIVFNQTRAGSMRRVLLGEDEGTLVGATDTVHSEGVIRP